MLFHSRGVHHENSKQHTNTYYSMHVHICYYQAMISPIVIIYRDTGEMVSTDMDLAELFGREMLIKTSRLFRRIDFSGTIEIIQFKYESDRDEYARVVKV